MLHQELKLAIFLVIILPIIIVHHLNLFQDWLELLIQLKGYPIHGHILFWMPQINVFSHIFRVQTRLINSQTFQYRQVHSMIITEILPQLQKCIQMDRLDRLQIHMITRYLHLNGYWVGQLLRQFNLQVILQ